MNTIKDYDICVITAANECQAAGYRKQIEWRRGRQMLPERTEFLVCADPGGRRIGSGGSTIHVLHELLQRAGGSIDRAFRNKRVLILHSGGDSRRLPAYSAIGKIFAPLPTEKFFAAFDVLFDHMVKLPVQDDGQVIAASGDVLLAFDPAHVAFAGTGITGVAYPDSPEVAAGHGVYVTSHGAVEGNPRKVVEFLQKPDLDELRRAKALDLADRAFVDTGIMNLAMDAVEKLVGLSDLSKRIRNGDIRLDLYKDVTFAMLGKVKIPHAEALSEIPFRVSRLPYCGFFHIGKSAQFLRSLYTLTHAGALYDFRNFTRSVVARPAEQGGAFIYNALVDADAASIRQPALIEGSHINGRLKLDGENILTGVPQGAGDIALGKGICLSVVPVTDGGWASVIYGIHDDFKEAVGSDGCAFLNTDFSQWMARRGIAPAELWQEGEARELWNARLFPVSAGARESVQTALNLQHEEHDAASWNAARRMSLNEILQQADHERLLDAYTRRDTKAKLASAATLLTPGNDLASQEVIAWCRQPEDYAQLAKQVLSMLDGSDGPLFLARLWRLLSRLVREADGRGTRIALPGHDLCPEAMENRAFALIQEAVGRGLHRDESTSEKKIRIRSDEVVWVCLPARLDFAGGWLDTPPQCLERGGSVLNAAVTLNGQYPIQVIGKVCDEPVVRISSIDLGRHAVIGDLKELLSHSDPSDWLALPKSAFVAAGLISPDTGGDLADILRQFGGGIDLTLFSAVPSGSGLGTSSILGAGIIACLSRMFGIELTPNDLFNSTLYMEQLMTTGGGWQDQIGGVVGGVKLIRTEPGLFQTPSISWTDLAPPGKPLSDRFLLYYTGHRRMAKDILRHIVGHYLDRHPETLHAMDGLRRLSLAMKATLDQRDTDSFGEQIAQVWELNKKLDPGSTNDPIDSILGQISRWVLGAKLLGAGGGGFLFIVTKGPQETADLKNALTQKPPNPLARFFDFDIERGGLRLNVL